MVSGFWARSVTMTCVKPLRVAVIWSSSARMGLAREGWWRAMNEAASAAGGDWWKLEMIGEVETRRAAAE